jgi:hypothetical protein
MAIGPGILRESRPDGNHTIGGVSTHMIDQDVVERDDSLVAVAGIRALLEPVEPTLIERLLIPLSLSEPAIQTGLVCRDGELSVDSRDVLSVGDDQPRQILGEMTAFRLIGEQRAELFQGLLDDGRVRQYTRDTGIRRVRKCRLSMLFWV